MGVTIYGIKNCSSMKKAFDKLTQLGVAYEFFDYKKQVLDMAAFEQFAQNFDLSILINKKGTTYRKLDDAQKAIIESVINKPNELSVLYELVKDNQSLLKRPVVLGDWQDKSVALIGFDEAEFEQNFNK